MDLASNMTQLGLNQSGPSEDTPGMYSKGKGGETGVTGQRNNLLNWNKVNIMKKRRLKSLLLQMGMDNTGTRHNLIQRYWNAVNGAGGGASTGAGTSAGKGTGVIDGTDAGVDTSVSVGTITSAGVATGAGTSCNASTEVSIGVSCGKGGSASVGAGASAGTSTGTSGLGAEEESKEEAARHGIATCGNLVSGYTGSQSGSSTSSASSSQTQECWHKH